MYKRQTTTYGKIEGIIYATLHKDKIKKEDFTKETAQILESNRETSSTTLLDETSCFKWSTLSVSYTHLDVYKRQYQ